jgi:protein-tyrosine phosphatase
VRALRNQSTRQIAGNAMKILSVRQPWASLIRGAEKVGPISLFTLQALADRGIAPWARFPLPCNNEDLESSHLVVAIKEADHRFLLPERFPGWENRVLYWNIHDIDAANPTDAIATIDRLVLELVRARVDSSLVRSTEGRP